MNIRATIEFPVDEHGGCADSVETFPTLREADRWGKVMERLTPGAVYMDPEQFCPTHAKWEERCSCEDCAGEVCVQAGDDGPWLCEDCYEARADGLECQCPGEAEAGPCFCPYCRRLPCR